MQSRYSPLNPPSRFWGKSWQLVLQLIANGFLKAAAVVGSYYWVKTLSANLKNNEQIDITTLSYLLMVACGLILLRLHERYTAEKMSQKYINRIRSGLLKRLMRASLREVESKTIGNLSSRLSGDLSSLKRWLSLGISRIITHSILIVITVSLIVSINALLGAVIAFAIITLLLSVMFLGSQLKKQIKEVRKNRIRINSLIVERLSSIAMIRTMGQEQKEINKINEVAQKLEKVIARQGIYLGLLRGVGDASSLFLVGLFFLINALNGLNLALDEMTALISIILFLNSPIRELGRVQEYYQGAKLSLSKLQELYDMPRIVRGRSNQVGVLKTSESSGHVLFRNVTLSPVFSGLNLRSKKGETIALIGKNGSGKSTIIQLLLGLIKPESGVVKVGGVFPSKIKPSSRAKIIGCSSADFGLIKGSLKQNLCYRKPLARKSEIKKLLIYCQLNELVASLPKGLSTRVNEKGNNFSSGEKARISLFRALIGKPSILILDEPESFLDRQGLSVIHKLINEYQGTVIVATHNSELISLCSRKWDLNKRVNKTSKKPKNLLMLKQNVNNNVKPRG